MKQDKESSNNNNMIEIAMDGHLQKMQVRVQNDYTRFVLKQTQQAIFK